MGKFTERFKLENGILGLILVNGVDSSKADVLGENPMEDKVYTKKIKIGKIYNSVEIEYVTLTSDDPLFTNISLDNVRVNTKNRNGKWCNLFIKEIPVDMLKFIWKRIHEKGISYK
jgi:hypothetical protein